VNQLLWEYNGEDRKVQIRSNNAGFVVTRTRRAAPPSRDWDVIDAYQAPTYQLARSTAEMWQVMEEGRMP